GLRQMSGWYQQGLRQMSGWYQQGLRQMSGLATHPAATPQNINTAERQSSDSEGSSTEQTRSARASRATSIASIIDSAIDSLYPEEPKSRSRPLSRSRRPKINSIMTLSNLDPSFYSMLDDELQMLIKWKYQDVLGNSQVNLDDLDDLVNILKNVRCNLLQGEMVTDDMVLFVCRFLQATGYETVMELEDSLAAHKMFRMYMDDLLAPSSEVEPPVEGAGHVSPEQLVFPNLDQRRARQDSAQASEPAVFSHVSDPVQAFQPFLGDSYVRSKVRKPKVHEKSPKEKADKSDKEHDPKKPLQKGHCFDSNIREQDTPQRGRIQQSKSIERAKAIKERQQKQDHDSNFIIQLETENTLKVVKRQESNDSESLKEATYERDLQVAFQEAEDAFGDPYFLVLKGVKDNFELAELLEYVVYRNGEPVNDIYMGAVRLQPQFIMEMIACSPFQLSAVASSDAWDVSSVSTGVTRTAETWQSRVRSFYQRTMQEKDLGSRQKLIQLGEELCPKCHERYRWPHILHCCHRFCFPCIVKLYRKDRNFFTCPICLCCSLPPKNSPFGPCSLPIDMPFAREMLEANLSPFCCTNCVSYEDAVNFCTDCLVYLCQQCCLLHDQSKSSSQHKLENTDTKIGATPDGQILVMCRKHPGNGMVKFCRTCWSGICNLCLDRDHNSHEILELSDAKVIIGQRVKTNNGYVQELSVRYHRLLMELKKTKQEIEAIHKAGRHIISEINRNLTEKIEYLARIARDEVERICNRVHHIHIEAAAERDKYLKEKAAFMAFVERFNESSNLDKMMLLPTVGERKRYLDDKLRRNPYLLTLDFNFKFEPKYPEVNHAIEEIFTSVQLECDYYLNRTLLNSQCVRDRHHVEPYQPAPYSLDYRFQSETADRQGQQFSGIETSAGAEKDAGIQDIQRQTVQYSRIFGRYGRGTYEFAEPSGVLYLHDCTLAVCDTRNHRIVIYTEDGTHLRTIGQPKVIPDLPPPSEEADKTFPRIFGKLYFPYRMAQCPLTGNLVVLERPPSLNIQIFSFEGQFIRSFGSPHLQSPRGITVDTRGLILILESKTMNFFIFTPDGDLINKSVLGSLEFPNDVAAKGDTIYISDNRSHCVKTFDYSLNYRKTFGNESLTYYPISVGFNCNDYLVVTDNHNTFNITIFGHDGRVLAAFKSRAKHANCYNVALHPVRPELAVTTKEYQVLIFNYGDFTPEGCEPKT
ncbi:unnamed protein product, partial [Candidula unifasciata]